MVPEKRNKKYKNLQQGHQELFSTESKQSIQRKTFLNIAATQLSRTQNPVPTISDDAQPSNDETQVLDPARLDPGTLVPAGHTVVAVYTYIDNRLVVSTPTDNACDKPSTS